MRLILASASPRRAELLRAAGFEFEVLVAAVDESARPGEPPADYVSRLAAAKARAVQRSLDPAGTDTVVLGADTIVVVDDRLLGKPGGDQEAGEMLRLLAGRQHEVVTGVTLCRGGASVSHVERTAVVMAPMSEDEVGWYVRSGEGLDKAGAYAIQGLASRFVARIDGSYANVVGLPVAAVYVLLRELPRSAENA